MDETLQTTRKLWISFYSVVCWCRKKLWYNVEGCEATTETGSGGEVGKTKWEMKNLFKKLTNNNIVCLFATIFIYSSFYSPAAIAKKSLMAKTCKKIMLILCPALLIFSLVYFFCTCLYEAVILLLLWLPMLACICSDVRKYYCTLQNSIVFVERRKSLEGGCRWDIYIVYINVWVYNM